MSEPTDAPLEHFGKSRSNDRRCAGTGAALSPSDPAIRFVLGPSGEVVPDLKGSLPGRGAWITPTREALLGALTKGGFARQFKKAPQPAEGVTPDGFADQVTELVRDAALARLGLAKKAGYLVVGHDLARKLMPKGLAYMTPTDASAPEVAKVAAFLEKAGSVPHLPLPGDRFTVGSALGQDAVHVLLLKGGPSASALQSVILWRMIAA